MLFGTRLAALILTALSVGLSFAHLLEKAPRMRWEPELWMGATVFGGQYALFGVIGSILDPLTVVLAALLAYLVRRRGAVFTMTLSGALLLAAALVCWFVLVLPANEVMAGWSPGLVPDDFEDVRARWEGGHTVVAVVKLLGFAALVAGVLLETDKRMVRR